MTNEERTRTVVLLPGRKPKCVHCGRDISDGGYEVAVGARVEDNRREVLCADCLAPRATQARDHRGRAAGVERVEVLAEGEQDHLPTRERDVVLAMGRKGWTVERVRYRDPDREAWIEGRARVEGEEVAYHLSPDGEKWSHEFNARGGRLVLEHGAWEFRPAGVIVGPGAALRMLAEEFEAERREFSFGEDEDGVGAGV